MPRLTLTPWECAAVCLAAVPAVLCVQADLGATGGPCRSTLANKLDCPKATPTAACTTYDNKVCTSRTYTKTWADWFGCVADSTHSYYCYPLTNPDGSSQTATCAITFSCVLDQAGVTCQQGNQIGNTITSALYDEDEC